MERHNDIFREGRFVAEPRATVKVKVPLRSRITGFLVGKKTVEIPKYNPKQNQ